MSKAIATYFQIVYKFQISIRLDAYGTVGLTSQHFIATFDTQKQTLLCDGKVQKLTTKECELLSLLCQHMNEILERNYALKSIWIDDTYFNARSMDVYITKLRKLLKDDSAVEIINIHGKGYKLIAPGDEE